MILRTYTRCNKEHHSYNTNLAQFFAFQHRVLSLLLFVQAAVDIEKAFSRSRVLQRQRGTRNKTALLSLTRRLRHKIHHEGYYRIGFPNAFVGYSSLSLSLSLARKDVSRPAAVGKISKP